VTDPRTAELLAALESDSTLEAGGPFLKVAADYFARTRTGDGPVSTPRDRAEIAARFDEPLPMGMRPLAEVVARIERDVMPDVNRLMHPMAMGHQVSAPLASAVWADVVISAVNNSQAVWEMSPVSSVLEERVIGWMAGLAGYGRGAAGTMTSGGTEATFTAMLAARAAWRPDAWARGMGGGPMPVLVHGEHTHYAVTRSAGAMGLGTNNCAAIPSREFRMDVGALERELVRLHREKREVLAVVATAGSTATGSFDDLDAIGALCDRFGVWLHIDGAHGASALLSAKHRHRVRGIERARTIAWDPHKMMLMPLSAGMLLARDGRDLARAFTQKAPYLFHGADGAEALSPDLGTRSFQCSRRADVLKVWVALQRLGADGIGGLYDHLCGVTREFYEMLKERPDVFETVHEPESNILCWRMRGMSDEGMLALRERYNRSGAGWITTTVLGGRRVLRVTVMNPRTGSREAETLIAGLAHRKT
jgi:L-2,4-diaminobutyrate decarboxylase